MTHKQCLSTLLGRTSLCPISLCHNSDTGKSRWTNGAVPRTVCVLGSLELDTVVSPADESEGLDSKQIFSGITGFAFLP